MRCSILILAAMLAGCGYSPPAQTDTGSVKYRADLDACTASVPDAVDKHNSKTGLGWAGGPFTRWTRIDDGVDSCMGGKGWGHVRACTADELRQGSKSGSVVVTRNGIRCSDPNKPS